MNTLRNFALGILFVTGIFCCVVYISCKKDACQTVNCLNGGTCSGGICNCPQGWIETYCQTSAFAGNWTGSDVCDSTQKITVSIEIDPSSSDTTLFLIKTPHGLPASVKGTRSGATTLNISSQLCYSGYISGAFTLSSNNALTFTYTFKDTSSTSHSSQCSGHYTRL